MTDVVVLGAGRMGSQIAFEYALGGRRVALLARARDRGEAALRAALGVAAGPRRLAAAALDEAAARIRVVTDLDGVAGRPDVVLESLPEDLELKAEVLRPAAERWPRAIVASNTSSLSIGRIGSAVGAPERTVGTHYWNPPLLMPLVEVVPGPDTAPEVVERVTALLIELGKRPVRVRHDVPGFIWNRLQFALLREALWLIDAGVATADDVDEVVRDGLARRWRLTGPFETAELGGTETFARIAENLFPALSDAADAPRLRAWKSRDEATLAELAARRDAALAAELAADLAAERAAKREPAHAAELAADLAAQRAAPREAALPADLPADPAAG